MPDPIDPIRGPNRVRSQGRRASDRAPEEDETPVRANLPVVIDGPSASPPPISPHPADQPAAAFAAQILGGGERRGLKGGPQTLYAAKSAYLEAEWRGPMDRRTRTGKITKTEI